MHKIETLYLIKDTNTNIVQKLTYVAQVLLVYKRTNKNLKSIYKTSKIT